MHLAYDEAIPPLGILPQRNENICSHKTYVHTHMWVFSEALFIIAKKLETTQMFIKWWMRKQTVYPHN